jgi:hypothetical protein
MEPSEPSKVDKRFPSLKQFLYDTMVMYPPRPDAMETMFTEAYVMLSRHMDLFTQTRERKAQLADSGPAVMAERADILELYKTLALSSASFIRDCIQWMDKYRLLAARVFYDIGKPVSHMHMTIAMDTYRTGLGIMDYGWTETVLPAIESGTIAQSEALLDQLRDIVIETHNAHSNVRRILAAMLRESCHFKGFGIENVDRIMALPHASHGLDLEDFRNSILRIPEDAASLDEALEKLSSLLGSIKERMKGSEHRRTERDSPSRD